MPKLRLPRVHITERSIPYLGRRTACGLIALVPMVGRIHVKWGDPYYGRANEVTCNRCRSRYGIGDKYSGEIHVDGKPIPK